jgi:hypothetical protein
MLTVVLLGLLFVQLNIADLSPAPETARLKPKSPLVINLTISQNDDSAFRTITNVPFISNEYFELTATEIVFTPLRPYRMWRYSGITPVVIGLHTLQWRVNHPGSSMDYQITAQYEVTCSDGIICNGMERYIEGKCVAAAKDLCEDFDDCTIDTCDETQGRCAYTTVPNRPECVSCKAAKCKASCSGKVCGSDGCGGSCGSCSGNNTCNAGQCSSASFPGTCTTAYVITNEIAAFNFSGQLIKTGDTSIGINNIIPLCNLQSTASEQIYKIVNTYGSFVGIEARVTALNGDVEGLDTVLQLIEVNPATHPNPDVGCLESNGKPFFCVACSDDSSPPGGLSSRITWSMRAGYYYYLVVDGYSAAQVGPYKLTMTFTPGCTMACGGKYCGDSGCNGVQCGTCGAGLACSVSNVCAPFPCVPDCSNGRQCGDDGCGGSCGTCRNGYTCAGVRQKCKQISPCNHLVPLCRNGFKGSYGCPAGQWCGSDCECHPLKEPLMDLFVVRDQIQPVIVYNYLVTSGSCAIAEGCISSAGSRTIVKFATNVGNQGTAPFAPPAPPQNYPLLYEYGACHGHWHFSGFAQFNLLDPSNSTVVVGRKQSYCAEDSYRLFNGTQINCDASTDCSAQGLSRGWVDVYGPDLDCQFLDITNVAPGNYFIKMCTNQLRSFEELTYENNCAIVPFVIPVPPV